MESGLRFVKGEEREPSRLDFCRPYTSGVRLTVRRVVGWFFLLLILGLTIGLPLWGYFGRILPKCFVSTVKCYDYPDVVIDATVHQDGSMSVIERRTFAFRRGEFHF